MINCYGMDVEIFPNLFSVTFVDLKDYFKVFSDCVSDKKPIPLTDKLSVAEIRRRLDSVKSHIFYISDTDDSQLLLLAKFITDMKEGYYDINGNRVHVRTDLYGFNNKGYDDMMIKAFLMYFNHFTTTKALIKKLKEVSDTMIYLQAEDKNLYWTHEELKLIRNYRLPYKTVDLQSVFGLNSAGKNIDAETGEIKKYPKSLKQTSINLKWFELLDFTLPPITQRDIDLFYKHTELYRGYSIEQLNSVISNDFDRYICPEYIDSMLHYNKNDVFIVCEMARLKTDEINLRYSISNAFNVNVLSSSRANIADKLVTKFYSEMSGLHEVQFKDLRTEHNRLSFKHIIFKHIYFKTKIMQELLSDMKKISIYHTTDDFKRTIELFGNTYTVAKGGLHSADKPHIYKSTDKVFYRHYDIASYYPSMIISFNICPKHLNPAVFNKLVKFLKETRIECKHTKDEIKLVIKGVPNKIAAEALKIVINAIYGKLGSNMFWLYDRFAQMQVTINGQLMTLMLIEALEVEGIHVISANTDGIVVELHNDQLDLFNYITSKWAKENKLQADYEDYKYLFIRDVNNYIDVQIDGTIECKGTFNPNMYLRDLTKGFDMPIVSIAVLNYFLKGTPVMETLTKHTNILDFCKTQNVGRQFEVVYDIYKDGEVKSVTSQRHIRFYVSKRGVVVQKQHIQTGNRSVLASGLPVKLLNTLDDTPISERNIDYSYYYNEAYKIIDPVMLGFSSSQKGNNRLNTKSGKVLIKKYSHMYNSLFDDLDEQ